MFFSATAQLRPSSRGVCRTLMSGEASASERSQRTRMGKAMSKAADRVYGDYRIERGQEDYKGRQQYRLRLLSAQAGPRQEEEQQ
jgi:hypothetical protein